MYIQMLSERLASYVFFAIEKVELQFAGPLASLARFLDALSFRLKRFARALN